MIQVFLDLSLRVKNDAVAKALVTKYPKSPYFKGEGGVVACIVLSQKTGGWGDRDKQVLGAILASQLGLRTELWNNKRLSENSRWVAPEGR